MLKKCLIDESNMCKLATMLVVFLTFFLCAHSFTENNFVLEIPEQNEDLQICVLDILKKYFHEYKYIAYIDINGDDHIIKTVNSALIVHVTSRTSEAKMVVTSEGYLITAGNTNYFTQRFSILAKEPFWNPYGRFLIFIKHLLKEDLRTIFDVLLKYHVIDVVVIDESDTNLYTYNPFKNYLCGRSYDRIIDYGKCSNSCNKDLYPHKLVTGLKNCTFRVDCPHWPPFSMDPVRNKNINLPGIEQFVFNEISTLEDFKLNYSYNVDGEIFTIVQTNMFVNGPLDSLQKGETDVILGGMLLTQPRTRAFSYISSHLAYADDIRFLVKKATAVSPWKNIYLEFSVFVWIALLFTFLTYFIFFVLVARPKDLGQVWLNMLAYMFLSGTRLKNSRTRYIIISWIWFAYLINACYQTTLVSITLHPHNFYQVSDVDDIAAYNMKPCVSKVVKDFLHTEDLSFEENQGEDCNKLLESIHTVSRSYEKFTVVFHLMYVYNEYSFYDETGDSMIYAFKRPLSRLSYGIYMYKGFPLQEKLYMHVLRMRENGLIQRYMQLLHWQNNERFRFKEKLRKPYYIIPWGILFIGHTIAFIVLILEILVKKLINYKRHKRNM
ncbi:unnamed protein product [Euphydryas editha]|uniref:Putative ionotropic receptor ligand binding domain-containing protein n=1 Tax=Euphydryas editha TaxID=104508 RepID=A0AAU9VCG7_EUPED|nr:unnamed protein product [Euphydryas editha]